jgi:HK97 family phage portal protein
VSIEADERNRLWYRVARDYALGEPEELLPATDVVHLKFKMAGGSRYMGTSPAVLCAPSLALALDARALQRELLTNLNAPLFVMTAPGKISPETASRIKTEWDTNFSKRVSGRFKTAFVGEGLKPEGIPLADATKLAMIETFKFSIEEIGRAYGVPGVLLDETGAQTSTNAAEAMRAFASTALGPFAARVADELTRKVVNFGTWRVEFDLRDLLQTPAEQADRVVRFLNAGALSLNEVRASLGLAPVAGGDAIRAPVNVAPLDRWLAGMPAPEQQPGNAEVPDVADPDAGDAAQSRHLRAVT